MQDRTLDRSLNPAKVFFCCWLTDEGNRTSNHQELTTVAAELRISCTTLCPGTETEIGSFVAAGLFVACESANTVVAGGAESSVDFATTTETVRASENASFAGDADRTACDERIGSWSAGRLGRYSLC